MFDVPLFDLECPNCQHVVDAKPKAEPWLSSCHQCGFFLIIEPVIRKKPNKVLFEFVVKAVPK